MWQTEQRTQDIQGNEQGDKHNTVFQWFFRVEREPAPKQQLRKTLTRSGSRRYRGAAEVLRLHGVEHQGQAHQFRIHRHDRG